jgi:hypothetical protein
VLRFLGVIRAEVAYDSTDGDGGVLRAPNFIPPRPGGEPEGLASLVQQASNELLPPNWGISNTEGIVLIDLAGGASQILGPDRRVRHLRRSLGQAEFPAPPDRRLAALVEGACGDANGHLVVADWLEEHAEQAPAAALRASKAALPEPGEDEWLSFHGFAWRWLDRDVLLYLARLSVWFDGRSRMEAGQVLGLLHGPPAGPRRWARWLPEVPAAEAGKRLEEELQAGCPA